MSEGNSNSGEFISVGGNGCISGYGGGGFATNLTYVYPDPKDARLEALYKFINYFGKDSYSAKAVMIAKDEIATILDLTNKEQ